MRKKSWIGVDFDRTLSKREAAPGSSDIREPGPPVESMVARVKDWLNRGYDVRIVTARVSSIYPDVEEHRSIIHKWCIEHIGKQLPVVSEKDGLMLELWDDSVVRVERNTGRRVSPSFIEGCADDPPVALCQRCMKNVARYVAFTIDEWMLTCGICPIEAKWDSFLLRNIQYLVNAVRNTISACEEGEPIDVSTLRGLVGKDLSK